MKKQVSLAILLSLFVAIPQFSAQEAEQENEPIAFAVADEGLQFQAPGTWTKVQPRITFIEAEFSIPKVDGDPKNGRLTVMGAGGTIEANVERWEGQFGGAEATVEPIEVAGLSVKMVDITGTYTDSVGGPMNPNAKKVLREDYRMIAAIIQAGDKGNYFVKFYGPGNTVEQNLEGFKTMINGLVVVEGDEESPAPSVGSDTKGSDTK